MPLTSALGRRRHEDLCEFEASLIYSENSRTARAAVRPFLGRKKKKRGQQAEIKTQAFTPLLLCELIIYLSITK